MLESGPPGIAPRVGGVAAVALLALACTAPQRDDTPGGDEDLDSLVALPYVSWSEEEADASRSSVTIWDRERAWDGINLYTDDARELYLMDMDGRRLHTWRLPEGRNCEHFELLAGGRAVAVCAGQGLVLLDRDSTVLWAYQGQVHHDVAVLPDGSFLAPHGGDLREYQGRRVGFDTLAHISARGELLDRWRSFDHLEELQRLHPPTSLDRPPGRPTDKAFDYYHLNTIEVLPDTPLGRRDARFREGNLLICLRNVHLIAVLDRETYAVQWAWGPGELSFPHMPTMLPDGHLLVFDNGVQDRRSRVLELDPASGEIVWIYEGDPPRSFFSKRKGSNQRLPNGNTLICESDRGRAFEVTPDGEIVWEFWNPEIRKRRRKLIYRLLRLPADEVRSLFRRDPDTRSM